MVSSSPSRTATIAWGALHQRPHAQHGLGQSQPVVHPLFDEVWDDLGVRFRREPMAPMLQLGLERQVILDNAVVCHRYPTGAIRMRVRVGLGGTPVRRPARMPQRGGTLRIGAR